MTVTVSPHRTVFDVHDYGATGNGVTDDTAAIRSALSAAITAGGGTVYFPPGTYFCDSANRATAAGLTWLFAITGDNITFEGHGDASVISVNASNATSIFFLAGAGKPAGASSWASHTYTVATTYTINSASRGAQTVTTTTAANAGNFAAGDWCFIRTGQILENSSGEQPDSEINQVLSASAGTGVITLRWALSKAYAQEAVDTGGGYTYTSKVGGAGSNVTFGIAKVTDSTVQNFTIRNLKLVSTAVNSTIIGGQAYGLQLDNVTFDVVSAPTSFGNIRHARITNCRVKITTSATETYIWAPSTGCTDWIISGTDSSSNKVGYFHIHEGIANYKAIGNVVKNGDASGSAFNAVSIRGRAYDIQILDNSFSHNGNGPTIYVDGTCPGGGVISGNRCEGSNPGMSAISVSSDNWTIGPNDVGVGDSQNISIFGSSSYAPVMRLARYVKYTNTPVTLGYIPGAYAVLNVYVQVLEAFNSSTTDLLYVGYGSFPGDPSSYGYVNALDVSTTGIKTVTLGAFCYAGIGGVNQGKDIVARYVAGGTAATTGKALVILEYTPMEWIL